MKVSTPKEFSDNLRRDVEYRERVHIMRSWRNCLEVIEQTFKKHPNGVGVPMDVIKPNSLYVLDWRPNESDRFDGIRVEHVVSIENGMVCMANSHTDLETFAELVVAGPFSLVK